MKDELPEWMQSTFDPIKLAASIIINEAHKRAEEYKSEGEKQWRIRFVNCIVGTAGDVDLVLEKRIVGLQENWRKRDAKEKSD